MYWIKGQVQNGLHKLIVYSYYQISKLHEQDEYDQVIVLDFIAKNEQEFLDFYSKTKKL